MKRIAVYKVLIGDYDDLTDDIFRYQENDSEFVYDYYFISDRQLSLPAPWKLIIISKQFDSPAIENRFYKMGVPSIFDEYDYTIYLDSNIAINNDLNSLMANVVQDNHYLYAYPHFKNTTIEEEITNCFVFSRIKYREMLDAKKYLRDDLKTRVGFECGVLVRKTGIPLINELFQTWFNLYLNNIKRDQFYFSIALNKHGMTCHSLGENTIRSDDGIFRLYAHKNRLTILEKIYIAIKMRLYKIIKK